MSCCLGRGLTSAERDIGIKNALSNTILIVILGIVTGSNIMFSLTQIVAQIYSSASKGEITSGAVGSVVSFFVIIDSKIINFLLEHRLWSGVMSLLTALPSILMGKLLVSKDTLH